MSTSMYEEKNEVVEVIKLPENEIIWELSDNVEENKDYEELRGNLLNKIKKCHNILYSNCALPGTKAQSDIMKILCLVLLKNKFITKDAELMELCENAKKNGCLQDEEYFKYLEYCKDLKVLGKEDDILDRWDELVNEFLKNIFKTIYYDDDRRFHCDDEKTVSHLKGILSDIQIDDNFIDSFGSSCGDIHEMFRAYGDSDVAKKLGQYFTPRHLIHLIFHGIRVSKIKKPLIYNPCAGT